MHDLQLLVFSIWILILRYCMQLLPWFDISDIAIITVRDVGYRCIIHDINKSEAFNLLDNYLPENRQYI